MYPIPSLGHTEARAGIEPTLIAYETTLESNLLPDLGDSFHIYFAGAGFEPATGAYETPELPLLHPAIRKTKNDYLDKSMLNFNRKSLKCKLCSVY